MHDHVWYVHDYCMIDFIVFNPQRFTGNIEGSTDISRIWKHLKFKLRQGSKKTVPSLHKWWPLFCCFQAHVDNSTLCSGCFKIASNKIMRHHAYHTLNAKTQWLGNKWIMKINKESNMMRSFCIFPACLPIQTMWSSRLPRPKLADVQGQSMIKRYWKMLLPTVLSN